MHADALTTAMRKYLDQQVFGLNRHAVITRQSQ